MTIGGRSRPATPVVRVVNARPRVSAAAFDDIPCMCASFSFTATPSPAFGFFDEAFDVCVCADDIHLSITADQDWQHDTHSGGPFPDPETLRLELWTRPLSGTGGVYKFDVAYDSATTVRYLLSETSGAGSWSHTLTAQPPPAAGDVFELFLTELRTVGSPIAVTAKVNGATVLSDSRVPPHGWFYRGDLTPPCGMTVVMEANGIQTDDSTPVTWSDWLAEGTC